EIAVSDIAGGEQLTNDYAMLNLEEDERLKCRCGSPSCRGLIGPADQVRYEARWRREIQSALTCISQVKQVLGPLLAPESLAAARAHYANAGYPLERGALAGRIAAM
ncbi:MAG: hypothetical protein U1C55_06970, partial [Smithellaceae bacterium]|nr:hypothetical protein [Smithellaceae bacterium]